MNSMFSRETKDNPEQKASKSAAVSMLERATTVHKIFCAFFSQGTNP